MSNLKKNYPNYKEIDKAFQRYVEASTIYGKRLLELDKDSHRDIDDEESRKVKKNLLMLMWSIGRHKVHTVI